MSRDRERDVWHQKKGLEWEGNGGPQYQEEKYTLHFEHRR